jgi:hypothetical protein
MVSMDNNNKNGRQPVTEDQKHYNDSVRLGHLEREMGGIKGEVGLLKVAMTDNSAKLTAMQDQMNAIFRSLEKMADRVHEPKQINWGWIISAVMGILILGGSYTSLVTTPLQVDTLRNYELVKQLDEALHDVDTRLSFHEGQSSAGGCHVPVR